MRARWRRWRCTRKGHPSARQLGPWSPGAPVSFRCACGEVTETRRGDGVLLYANGQRTDAPLFPELDDDDPWNELAR